MKYKKTNKHKIKAGFTLIEVLIYITLSSLLLTGVIVSTYNLIDGNKWLLNRTIAMQEGHFVLQKINWLMKNEDTADFDVYLDDGRIWIERNQKEKRALTSSRVRVEGFGFTKGYLEFSVDGIIFKKRYE